MCPDTDEEIRVKTPLARLLVFSPTEGSVVGLFEDLFQIGDGLRSGVTDAPSFVINLLQGDVHGATTDGRNLIGDVVGILDGVEGLGVSLGEVPKRYLRSAAKLADSKILAAAQLAIEGQKALTGSGDPEEGNGYRDSARRLEDTVETLIDAAPKGDRWDGAAAEEYGRANTVHRKQASNTSVADKAIGEVIAREAGQVRRTRQTLDEASQTLYDFGLATSWMMFVPPLIPAKLEADIAAATAALGVTTKAISELAIDSVANAQRIMETLQDYAAVVSKETVGDASPDCNATLVSQQDDRMRLPTRIADGDNYTVPEPEVPDTGPPAIPYSNQSGGVPAPLLGISGSKPPGPSSPASSAGRTPSPAFTPKPAMPAASPGARGHATAAGRAPGPQPPSSGNESPTNG
ncbi:EspA/EspE family type VII secretion system effector [Mycolicibacterium obuense]|uniref:EspA/EspE family type VII secretion system effector n=1 Tax=Mycolicibacterium obuense TaxID=1807 RepID=UPI0019D6B826|nr:EspA/EspE family type VII secretion system effector [Mycolicibacterium obuense]